MERFGRLEASKADDRRRYVFYRVVRSAKAFLARAFKRGKENRQAATAMYTPESGRQRA